jgi:hypothetical protein
MRKTEGRIFLNLIKVPLIEKSSQDVLLLILRGDEVVATSESNFLRGPNRMLEVGEESVCRDGLSMVDGDSVRTRTGEDKLYYCCRS